MGELARPDEFTCELLAIGNSPGGLHLWKGADYSLDIDRLCGRGLLEAVPNAAGSYVYWITTAAGRLALFHSSLPRRNPQ